MPFFDLHSHVLPDLDDGARDPEMSLAMLRGLAALGFDTVCATPHQKDGQFLPSLESIRSAHRETRTRIAEHQLPLRLPLAAESMWDKVFYERAQTDQIPSYDDGPAFLVEFRNTALPTGLFETIFRLRAKGLLPVIAHPERYEPLWGNDELLMKLAANCALVVDLGAVAGYHGRKRTKAARTMLKKNLAHAVASDAHTPDDVRVAGEGIAWIRKKLGERAVTRLLDANPRLIFAGNHPDE